MNILHRAGLSTLLASAALATVCRAADEASASGPKSGNNPEGTQEITIQGHDFTIPAPYAAGHTLTDNEASAFNQLFAENVRNNTASAIKAAGEAQAKANGITDEAELKAYKLSSEDLDSIKVGEGDTAVTLREHVLGYANDYEFGARRTRSASEPVDPVQREAHRIATDAVRQALKDKNIKVKSLPEGWFDAKVKAYAATDDVQKEAKRRAKAASAIGLDELGLGDEPTGEAEA